jgi:hypothetical protein
MNTFLYTLGFASAIAYYCKDYLLIYFCKRKSDAEYAVFEGKNMTIFSYYHRGKQYKIAMKTKRLGPDEIVQVLDSQGTDLTSTVLPYMGPNQDFHAYLEYPIDLKDLVYITRTGQTL